MSKGIEVIWPDADGKIDEIEYFSGVDVDALDAMPSFSTVPTFWPRYNGGTAVEYTVRTECKERQNGEVHLVVEYRRTDNRQLDETYDINWGTNTIILRRGTRTGRCQWHRLGGTVRNDIRWKSFDLAAANQRPLASYLRSRRHAQFRNIILDCDRHRCVLTRDDTTPALEAAHLIPAKDGENDKPANGITLRADLHRLFDAGLFMLDEAGRVVLGDRESDLSDDYCQLLRNARLPQKTLERVRTTLALPQFRERKRARA